jgi:hypothetical protein
MPAPVKEYDDEEIRDVVCKLDEADWNRLRERVDQSVAPCTALPRERDCGRCALSH